MNDKRGPAKNPAATSTSRRNRSTVGGQTPRLVIEVELEELPRITIVADTAEDEARMRTWASQPQVVDRVPGEVARALAALGGLGRAA